MPTAMSRKHDRQHHRWVQFRRSNRSGHITTNAYQIGNDVNLVRGNHQLTFGANLANWRIYQRDHVSDQGAYAFNGTATGLGMGDFLTGRLTTLKQVTPVQWSSRQWYVATYLQDVWKHDPNIDPQRRCTLGTLSPAGSRLRSGPEPSRRRYVSLL